MCSDSQPVGQLPFVDPVGLVYSSTAANAQPIFLVHYQLPVGQAVPSTITAQLTLNNGTPGPLVYYNTSGLNPGDWMQIALQANATSLNTGRYPWSITVTNGSTPTTYSGNVDLVNQASSPYGAGWSLSDVEQLVPVTGGVILVNPDGTSLFFANNGSGGFITPAGDFSTLTLSNGVYTRTMPDGTQINFNSSGLQTSIVDRDGNTTRFGYNGSNQLTTITDFNNLVTTLTYSSGKLTSIEDPALRTATLAYTGNQLTSITDPGNNLWQYSYDSANDLTKLTDPRSNATTFTYNFADRVSGITRADSTTEQLTAVQMNGLAAPGTGTSSNPAAAVLLATGDEALYTDPRSNVWVTGLDWLGFGLAVAGIDPLGDVGLTYRDANGLPWMSSDPLARRTREFFNSGGDPTKVVQPDDSYFQYQYNGYGEVTQSTDPLGNITTNTYNAKGDLTNVTDALLHVTTYTYNSQGFVTSVTDPLLHTTTYNYDLRDRLTSIVNALNQTFTYGYDSASDRTSITDARGFTSTFAYNSMGWMTGATLADTSTTSSVYTFGYDSVGNQTSITDPLNHTTTSSYDKLNRLATVTDALNEITTYGYDANGNLTSITNPLNQTITLGYDAANRLTSETNALNQTTTYGYDAAGEKITETNALNQTTTYGYTVLGQLASVTNPLSDALTYGYNSAGENTSVSQGGPGNLTLTASMTYNAIGELTGYTDPLGNHTTYQYDAAGNLISITDPLTHTTSFGYNAINQPTSVTDALSHTVTYGYDADGNRTTVTDPLLRTTTSVYDAQGRLLSVTDPRNGTTTYTYDLAGNQTSITDPDNNTTSFGYDNVNRLTSMTDPLGHSTTYAYNAAGEMTAMTDRDGRQTTFGYDAAGRPTGQTWVGGSYTATYTYNAAGELSKAQDTFSSYSYGYDTSGQLTSVDNLGTPGVPHVVLTYGYDAYGDRTSLIDSLGDTVSFGYDNDLRLTSIGLSSTQSHTLLAQVTFGYDTASRQTGVTRSKPGADTITSVLGYDNADRLTNITHTDTTQALTLANYTYGYDTANQLTSYQDSNSSLTYGYDNNGELTSAAGTLNGSSYSVSYSYDANGNRNMTGYTTGTGNELTSDGTYSYTYDNEGNMVSQTNIATGYVTLYSYDYRNRLTEVKAEDNHGTVLNDEKFTYDVSNNRIGVSLNGTQQSYTVYDGKNPYMDFNGSGSLSQRYLTDPRGLNQLYARVSSSGTVNWYLTDNLSSVRQIISSSGTVLDKLTYDPFGGLVSETNAANGDRFKYTGGGYDSITGNYQFGVRYYTSRDGRFESQDPLGFGAMDSNLYRYAYNDSLGKEDPSGMDFISPTLGGQNNTGSTPPIKGGSTPQRPGPNSPIEEVQCWNAYQAELKRCNNMLDPAERDKCIANAVQDYYDCIEKNVPQPARPVVPTPSDIFNTGLTIIEMIRAVTVTYAPRLTPPVSPMPSLPVKPIFGPFPELQPVPAPNDEWEPPRPPIIYIPEPSTINILLMGIPHLIQKLFSPASG